MSDGRGATATDAVTIGVGRPTGDDPDACTYSAWSVNDTVSFSGSATDNQGVAVPASNLTWRLALKHGACPDCHEHFLQTYSGVASGSFTTPDHDYPSELELSLTATDASGLSNTTSVRLLPRTTTLTFGTNPTGLKLTFNGVSATTPFSRTVIEGSKNSLSAPTPQNLRGRQVFRTWSDGFTTAAHPQITATASAATYTATFSKK